MDKNDYDIDFDFEKELGFDPSQVPDAGQNDDFDLSEFQDIGLDSENQDDPSLAQYGQEEDYGQENYNAQDDSGFDDFDLEGLDLGEMPGADDTQDQQDWQEPEQAVQDDFDYSDEDLLRRPRTEQTPEQSYSEEEYPEGESPEGEYAEGEYREGEYDQGEYPEGEYPEEEGAEGPYSEEEYPEGDYAEEAYEPEQPREKKHWNLKKREKKEREPREVRVKKPGMPPFFKNFIVLYFGAAIAELTGMNREQEGRRRRSKLRIFKEAYLPPLILLVSFILVVTFIIGSASNMVQRKLVSDEEARKESVAASEEQDRLQGEYAECMSNAAQAAQEYDFERAIQILDSYTGEPPQEMLTRRAEYAQSATKMMEWKDPTGIPNLSFHCLVADPARAYANKDLGGKYNQNFVTTDEFQRILESLYANHYVLVDFDSFVERSEGLDGTETFAIKPILLPEDKKPVMLTETLVSYYDYMIDSNKDGKPDAGGAGFASRLVVDANGDIKAEMVDKDGNTMVGDFDLVPILETFLKEHPDFSYRGSRAILAPTGEQGIFGYRIQTSVISDPKFGQTYYNEQVQGAKELVQALRDKGYTMASYTYGNKNYGQVNANQITEDLQSWDTQITPVIGNTDIMVFAQGGDIGDYTGTKYKALYDKGYRFFVGQSDKPFADVSNSYVRQKRLMVTGSNMFWNGKMFSGMFDTAAVLNSMRGDVPKAK